jgi:hypothetical protein
METFLFYRTVRGLYFLLSFPYSALMKGKLPKFSIKSNHLSLEIVQLRPKYGANIPWPNENWMLNPTVWYAQSPKRQQPKHQTATLKQKAAHLVWSGRQPACRKHSLRPGRNAKTPSLQTLMTRRLHF